MEMNISSRDFWETFPILTVKEGIIVSKRGDITVGWKLTLPPAYSIGQDAYSDLNQRMHGAIRSLPPWMLVHRQDMYLRRKYAADEDASSFLGHRNEQLFRGREHLEHHAFLFLTLASRASALRPEPATQLLPAEEYDGYSGSRAQNFMLMDKNGNRVYGYCCDIGT